MTDHETSGVLTAILPSNNLDASEKFYNRLGFKRPPQGKATTKEPENYRILSNGAGGHLHLTEAVDGWLAHDRNPFGLYFYVKNVDELAAEFNGEIISDTGPTDKPWGMYEFAVSDPDGTLVRVGWPTRLRMMKASSGLA